MMTLEEAIQHCNEKANGDCACADDHRQLAEWLTELLEWRKTAPHWIPCSKKVPEKAGEYIVTDDSGGLKCINISHFYPDAAPVNGDDMRWDYINVTAWMPMPEAYKEGEKE